MKYAILVATIVMSLLVQSVSAGIRDGARQATATGTPVVEHARGAFDVNDNLADRASPALEEVKKIVADLRMELAAAKKNANSSAFTSQQALIETQRAAQAQQAQNVNNNCRR